MILEQQCNLLHFRFIWWANEKLSDDVDFAFRMELIFTLVDALISKITAFEAQKTHTNYNQSHQYFFES